MAVCYAHLYISVNTTEAFDDTLLRVTWLSVSISTYPLTAPPEAFMHGAKELLAGFMFVGILNILIPSVVVPFRIEQHIMPRLPIR